MILKDRASVPQVLAEMTLQEKAQLVTGATPFGTQAIPRLGIPSARLLDGGTGVNLVQYFNDLLTHLRLQENGEAATGLFGVVSATTVRRILRKKEQGEELDDREAQIFDTCMTELKKIVPAAKAPGAFPPGMLLGATWSPETVRRCGSAVGREMDAYQVDLVLGSPNINVLRDPLNGRIYEGYSEDPCLNATLAPQFVQGIQQEGPLANVKHFVANNQETCRHTVNVHVSERALQEIYFPGFRACVQDGNVKTVMSAYNRVNGTACAMNHKLLTDTLRKDWGFDGMVVSDWGAAYDQAEALSAGNDLDMPGPRRIQPILDALENGTLTEQTLNQAAERILNALVEMPVMKGRKHKTIDRAYSREAAYQCAAEGMVLLKNSGVLPLNKAQRVSCLGRACQRFIEVGSGSTEVFTDQWTSLLGCVRDIAGETAVCWNRIDPQGDAVVVAVTAKGQEGSDRENLNLNPEEKSMLRDAITQAKQFHQSVIVILNVAGPVDISEFLSDVDAILCVFFPGMEGGRAAADILYGLCNPSGKLPMTFPLHYRDCPSCGNFPGCANEVYYGEGVYVGYRYYDLKQCRPAFAFGHGLSYTQFVLSDLHLERMVMDVDLGQCAEATVTIENVGKMDGKEVVQLYVHDPVSTLDKPVKELKAFQKVFLKAGEKKQISFRITSRMLESYDPRYGWVCEAGQYDLLVGTASDHICCRETLRVKHHSAYDYGPQTPLRTLYADERSRVMLESLIDQLGMPTSVLEDELYYRQFRPIQTILQNLTDVQEPNHMACIRAFYAKVRQLDLSEIQ